MAGTIRQTSPGVLGTGSQPFSKLARKIVVAVGDDGYVPSHCHTMLDVLRELAREVVIVGRARDWRGQIATFSDSVIDLDCRASLNNPLRDSLAAWKLAQAFEEEDADAVHLLGIRPVALGSLALRLVRGKRVVVHLPDLERFEPETISSRIYRPSPANLVKSLVRRSGSFLIVEDASDLTYLRANGIDPGARFAVLGGAGVDPDVYPLLPPSPSQVPVVAYAGRFAKSGGLDVLMRAFTRVWARGVRVHLDLVESDASQAADAISAQDIGQWLAHPGVRLTKPIDMREVWRQAEICVMPAVGRFGLPRQVLEAAACGRALIVTNGAGGDSFVRDGVEGLVVPRGDAMALAEAIECLARDPDLRLRLGEAARLRVLQGFTELHVKQALRDAYLAVFGMLKDR